MNTITVSALLSDCADYLSIQDALHFAETLKEPVEIQIYPGIYHEKITVSSPAITIRGLGSYAWETVITYADFANDLMPDKTKRGTFRSYTLLVDANDFSAYNLTIENSAGLGRKVGQAIAAYVDGDRVSFHRCRFLGNQDTLFTGPLPLKELQPGGFIGPKEFAARIIGRQYYDHCYICGNIDFIFGSAIAYFDHCKIESVLPVEQTDAIPECCGYITAASTYKGQEFGYVFSHCSFTSNCPAHSVYLGRPWRDYAQTVLISCSLDNHIKPEGWYDWEKPLARTHCFYREYKNTGVGSSDMSRRASFAGILTESEQLNYTLSNVCKGKDGWLPTSVL